MADNDTTGLVADSQEDADEGRRGLMAVVLGLFGASALAACSGAESEPLATSSAAASGAAGDIVVTWVDTVLGPGFPAGTRDGDLATKTSAMLDASGKKVVAVAKGCLTPGDNGGGVFYWSAGAPLTDDGGIVIVPNSLGTGSTGASGVNGCWVRIYAGLLGAKWFGAQGDGTTDDANALQAAVNAAQSQGGGVFLTKGNYIVGTSISINSGTSLRGAGASSTLRAKAGVTLDIVTMTNVNDVVIESISFQGNNCSRGPAPYVGNGIRATATTRVKVHDCIFNGFGSSDDSGGGAIYFYAGNFDAQICDNYISGGRGDTNGFDIELYSANGDTLISGNTCLSSNSTGIATSFAGMSSATGKIKIVSNTCKNHKRHGIAPVYDGAGILDTIVEGNICVDNASTGIYVSTGSSGYLIVGNVVHCCSGGGPNSAPLAGGIVVQGTSDTGAPGRKLVAHNFIANTGIATDGAVRAGYPDGPVSESTAIRVNNSEDCVVVDNIVEHSVGFGIRLFNQFRRAVVRGNRIFDVAKSAIELYTTSVVDDLDVSENHISCTSANGIDVYFTAADSKLVSICRNVVMGNKSVGKFGIGLNYHFSGRVQDNDVQGWDIGVQMDNASFVTDDVGRTVLFDNNSVLDCNTSLRHNATVANVSFGTRNRFGTGSIVGVGGGVFFNATPSYRSTAPTAAGRIGDVVYNTAPAAGGFVGWVYTSTGWKPFGAISP